MKTRILSLLAATLLTLATASHAAPILNTANDNFEDRLDGSAYSTYVNTGEFLYVQPGNNEGNNLLEVQTILNSFLGTNLTLVADTNVIFTGANGSSGTWTATPFPNVINFYAIKAGNAYAMYEVDPATDSGSWSTFDLWNAGYGGHGGLDISHFTGYDSGSTPVPEPGTILLLSLGLAGVAIYRKRRMN